MELPTSFQLDQTTAKLRSLDAETEALRSQMEHGERREPDVTIRKRLGYFVKKRLYRFLWWQSYQLKTLAELVAKRGVEGTKAIEAISQATADVHRVVFDCRRQVKDNDIRLHQLELMHSRLQAAERERDERERECDFLRQEVGELTRQIECERARLTELAERFERESSRVSEAALLSHQARAALIIQDRRLTRFIEEARKRLEGPPDGNPLLKIVSEHSQHKYDSLYVAFEDLFRGTREEIKTRQSEYLPLLREHGIGCSKMAILDLGCGRGEWLELLGEQGLEAVGVDDNEAMIESCKPTGLKVIQSEALSYLTSLPDASLGAVTSFHMVEHLPFETTLELIDEILRVLKPGGLIILETPNPENLLVGAYTFYFDPSHLKPLPGPMLRFFVEARGFCEVRMLSLHPCPEATHLPEDGRLISSRLNHYLYGPQDYAVVGRKP